MERMASPDGKKSTQANIIKGKEKIGSVYKKSNSRMDQLKLKNRKAQFQFTNQR